MKVIFVSVKRIHTSLVHKINTPKSESSLLQPQQGLNGGITSLTLTMYTINFLQAQTFSTELTSLAFIFLFLSFLKPEVKTISYMLVSIDLEPEHNIFQH